MSSMVVRDTERKTDRKEKMQNTEFGVMWLQVNECQTAKSHQKLEESRNTFHSRTFRGPDDSLSSDFCPT